MFSLLFWKQNSNMCLFQSGKDIPPFVRLSLRTLQYLVRNFEIIYSEQSLIGMIYCKMFNLLFWKQNSNMCLFQSGKDIPPFVRLSLRTLQYLVRNFKIIYREQSLISKMFNLLFWKQILFFIFLIFMCMPDFISECALHLIQSIKIKWKKVLFQIFCWIEIVWKDPKYYSKWSGDHFGNSFILLE